MRFFGKGGGGGGHTYAHTHTCTHTSDKLNQQYYTTCMYMYVFSKAMGALQGKRGKEREVGWKEFNTYRVSTEQRGASINCSKTSVADGFTKLKVVL